MALAEVDLNVMSGNEEAPKKKNNKRLSVERIYQKKTQLEHIILRPDSYIGSVEPCQQNMWIFHDESHSIINKSITFTPGLYKIFDEILVNAADNKQRDPRMNMIKVNIDIEKNTISVWNNGKGIPIEIHKTEKVYIPTMIFGQLLTSSNYDDTEKKVVGGRNGFGAKLCNIFSKKFTVETSANGKKFKQVWKNNMGKTEPEKVSDTSGTDFTCITFTPDLEKFKMEKLDEDFVALLKRRAYDIAGVCRGVSVMLNGDKIKVKTFKDYVQLHIKGATLSKKDDGMDHPDPKIIHEIVNPRWEVCVTISETGFQQSSFVNSIATSKGGTHVNYLVDQICEKLIATIKKKTGKGGFNIKPFQVKSHLWVFANTLIENPTFDSQTKENMTLRKTSFGSVCELSEKYIKMVQDCGILENILSWVRFKSEAQLNKKTFSNKHSRLKGIPKLDDANDAGTKNSRSCTLIITEGDSAKALAMSGVSVIGRDKYGVFPLRGKMLNVRDASHKQIMDNAEVGHLVKIIGLQFGKKYTEEDMKTLRYGHLMIMADQDTDGSHIKGLVINFIHANWPQLLQIPFLEEFITPIVKVSKGSQTFSFFSLPEFEEWKNETNNPKSWRIKYYKGLGTSTSKEGKEYFSNMQRHRIVFEYDGPSSDQAIVMAFSKKCANERKLWLTNGMEERKLRKEAGLPQLFLYEKGTKSITYRDFINKELILFSNSDNERSIPSLVDGLKPGQRKVLFTCMKRNDKTEVKVAQLAGSVGEMSAYHHGEVSLMGTIVGLAQNFVGSNNLNLLVPHGQFGTRSTGGKDSASPRYICTMMSTLTRLIYPAFDDNVLTFLYDDNIKIEPEWYCPIIPMILVNGAEGIGTGYSTKIPNYDVRELVAITRAYIAEEEIVTEIKPSFKNFLGDMEKTEAQRYISYGNISVIDETTVEISELPVRCWTQNYKEGVLDVLLYGNDKVPPSITDYKEHHTDTTVKFIVSLTPEQLAKAEDEGLHKKFKLENSLTTSSMVLFDEYGCLKKFENVIDIIKIFHDVRLKKYQERRIFMLGMLEAECSKLENQARFILEKIEGKLIIENRSRRDVITTLVERGFNSDPVKTWKASIETAATPFDDNEDDSQPSRTDAASSTSTVSGGPDFQYLLTMPIMSLSKEKKEDLLRQRDDKKEELEKLRAKTPQELWLNELEVFVEELEKVEEQERLDDKLSAGTKQLGQSRSAKGKLAKPKKSAVPIKAVKKKEPSNKDASKKSTVSLNTIKEEVDAGNDIPNDDGSQEVLSLANRMKKNVGGNTKKKQTTLSFKNQKRKANFGSDSDDSEDDFKPDVHSEEDDLEILPKRAPLRQKAAKKYTVEDVSDDESDESDDQSKSEDDNGGFQIPKKGAALKRKGDEMSESFEVAETRALIEKLSPMKKKPNTEKTLSSCKPKSPSKLTLPDASLTIVQTINPVSVEGSPVKKDKVKEQKKRKVIQKKKTLNDKKDSQFLGSSEDPISLEDSPLKNNGAPTLKKKVIKKDTKQSSISFEPTNKNGNSEKCKPSFEFESSDESSDEEVHDNVKSERSSSKRQISSGDDSTSPVAKRVDVKGKEKSSMLTKKPSQPKNTSAKMKKAPAKSNKGRKKDSGSDSDFAAEFEDEKDILPVRERLGGRTAAVVGKKKYNFSSSSDNDSDSDFC